MFINWRDKVITYQMDYLHFSFLTCYLLCWVSLVKYLFIVSWGESGIFVDEFFKGLKNRFMWLIFKGSMNKDSIDLL